MNVDRLMRIAVAFAVQTAKSPTERLCAVCVDMLDVSGAGITIMGGDQAGPICVSDSSIAALEDLQFTMGQGPCRDAFKSGTSVHAPRLDATTSLLWPSFVDLAKASGIGAVFAYPLVSKGAKIGVLTLYQLDEGELTDEQQHDGVAIAAVLTEAVLSAQEDAPAGTLAPSLEEALAYRAEIYQASGIVAVQLQIPAAEALLRIRAHAFACDRPIADAAADIVARRLRLPDDRHDPHRPDHTGPDHLGPDHTGEVPDHD